MDSVSRHLSKNPTMYVSITGLKVKAWWKFMFFIRHAVMSKMQADQAPGILHSSVKTINGIQHTLTAWESKAAMQRYIYSGAHMKAIRSFKKIATGKTFGYDSDRLPDWSEVHQLWKDHGKDY